MPKESRSKNNKNKIKIIDKKDWKCNVKKFLDRITFILAIILLAIVPFIFYPKLIEAGKVAIYDFFAYHKAVVQYIMAIIACILLFAHRLILSRPIRIRMSFALFILWAGISTIFSSHQNFAFWGIYMRNQGLASYICYFIFFVYFLSVFQKNHITPIIYVLLSSSAIMSCLTILEYYKIQYINLLMGMKLDFPTQIHTTFGNSNCLGSYFSLMVPLGFMMFIQSKNKKETLILMFLTVMSFQGLILSLTRVAWVGVLLSLGFFLSFFLKDLKFIYKKLIVFGSIVLILTFLFNYTGKSRISKQYIDAVKQTKQAVKKDIRRFASYRFYVYEKFIHLTLSNVKNALVGVGPDCLFFFGKVPAKDEKKFPNLRGITFDKAHSEIIEYAATMGIPALILYMWFFLILFYFTIKKIKSASPEIISIFAGWLAYLIQSFFNIAIIGIVGIFFFYSALLYQQISKNDSGFK
jgi:putative inorganic carbon (HCO3(-)) transporter